MNVVICGEPAAGDPRQPPDGQQPAVRGRAGLFPVLAMVLYLVAVRRTGALDNL